MYHELSLIVLGILYQGADGSNSHVTPLVFSFSNRKDPNYAPTFQMIRMGSVRDCFSVATAAMSGLRAGGHLWLRHSGIRPPQYENPTLHIRVRWGRPFWTLMPHPSFSPNDSLHAPCSHGGQGSAIS